jgi:hypothetical protein
VCSRISVDAFNGVDGVVCVAKVMHNSEKFLVVNHIKCRAELKVGSIEILLKECCIFYVV